MKVKGLSFAVGCFFEQWRACPVLQYRTPSYGRSWQRYFGQPAAQTHPHLIAEGEVTPGISKEEYHRRRCNLVKAAAAKFKGVKRVNSHLFIFPSASTVYMTNDIPYPFRQNTDFLYFSGFQEPDSVLLIEADRSSEKDGEHTSLLFVPRKDAAKELWDGPRSGVDGTLMLTGVDAAFNSGELEKYLDYYNTQHKDYVLWFDHSKPIHKSVQQAVISQLTKEKRHKCVESTMRLSHELRLIKSPAEIDLMQKSVDIASRAFVEVMKFSKPQVNEAHLWAKMDFECRLHGAEFLAYPPVVAGGPRANTIHYITNNQQIEGGQMVLMDAGCELHGYASDLTRTWPVSGRFTPTQKKLYNATLRVQESCIRLCRPGYSLDELFQHMLVLLAAELTHLGIISPDCSHDHRLQLARKFCPHHVSHYLGMDVHDTCSVSRKVKLQPNMIVTVEPGEIVLLPLNTGFLHALEPLSVQESGIYVPENEFTVCPEFRGIGIRIEDNILITASEPVVLSASCPKRVDDIESLMSERKSHSST